MAESDKAGINFRRGADLKRGGDPEFLDDIGEVNAQTPEEAEAHRKALEDLRRGLGGHAAKQAQEIPDLSTHSPGLAPSVYEAPPLGAVTVVNSPEEIAANAAGRKRAAAE